MAILCEALNILGLVHNGKSCATSLHVSSSNLMNKAKNSNSITIKGIHIEIRECPPELVKTLSIKRLDPFKAKYKVII